MVNACILYGATNWAWVNILVILISLLALAAVYMISRFLSNNMRERIRDASRSELTQLFLSAVLLAILAGSALSVCSISFSISKQLTGQGMDPFAYSEYYIGNLSTNTGLNLLTNIYSVSVSYNIQSEILSSIGTIFNAKFSDAFRLLGSALSSIFTLGASGNPISIFSLSIAAVSQLSGMFHFLSEFVMALSIPVTLVVGLLFVQFIALPVLQVSAFTVILPIAIAMRSLSFLGINLRKAANTAIAIAVAAYIVYPLMISFNSYAIAWIFSGSNPSYQYIQSAFVVPNITPGIFFTQVAPGPGTGSIGTAFGSLLPFVWGSFSSTGVVLWPPSVFAQIQSIINETAQFLFTGGVMILLDIAVTLGFATNLQKGLNSGIEGAAEFWGGI